MRHPLFSSLRSARSRRGIALISVLIMVALITAVVVGFIVAAGLEMTSSRLYSASASARLMGDTAVNLAQAQINEATSQGPGYAWATQPGAIRVYNNTGGLFNIYKLYSAQSLTTNNATMMDVASTAAGADDMPPTSWANYTALWVDLNASVTDSQLNIHFPIFDPRTTLFSLTSGGVDGCSATSIGSSTPITPGPSATVPMPVVWLYVLQNGQIIEPDSADTGGSSGTGTVATFQNTASGIAPSSSNPIVGRIAFWTDDDTCKVNINTAGADGYMPIGSTDPTPIANATFWDTPHYNSPDDVGPLTSTMQGLAVGQPASGEFQRYPGHPASVALNNILYGLGWTLPGTIISGTSHTPGSFYNNGSTPGITPRYGYGGSESDVNDTIYVAASLNTSAIPYVPNPQNRLYTSVAEMLFQPSRAPSALNNVANLASGDTVRQQIEAARFFLTAHSQAPEVNLFGEPRVSVWPVWDSTVTAHTRTTTDKLLCFASTVNGNGTSPYPYYFTRADSTSSTTDVGLPRNKVLLTYLDSLTATPIPGYGNTFQAKYSTSGMRQILTEIFDYIRTINTCDTSQLTIVGSQGGANTQEYGKPWYSGTGYGYAQVAPSVITKTNNNNPWGDGQSYQGFGSFPRLNEIAIEFVALGQGILSANPPPGAPPVLISTGATQPYYSFFNAAYATNINAPTSAIPNPPPVTSSSFIAGDSGLNPNNYESATTPLVFQTPVSNMVMIAAKNANWNPTSPWNNHNAPAGSILPPDDTVAVQAVMLLDFTDPSQMFISDQAQTGHILPFVNVEIQHLDQFRVSTASTLPVGTSYSLGFPSDDITAWYTSTSGNPNNNWDQINFVYPLYDGFGGGLKNGASGPQSHYPFYSGIIPLAVTQPGLVNNTKTAGYGTGLFNFIGASITVSLYDGGTAPPSGTAQIVQNYTINFGEANGSFQSILPLPVVNASAASGGGASTILGSGPTLQGHVSSYSTTGNGCIIMPGDTVASMVLSPQYSDARTLATYAVPSAAFIMHPVWTALESNPAITTSIAYPDALAYSLFVSEVPWHSSESATNGTGTPAANPPTYLPPYPSALLGPGVLNPNATLTSGQYTGTSSYETYTEPYVPPELNLTTMKNSQYSAYFPSNSNSSTGTGALMDWDTGIGLLSDGPWINKVDEGNITNNGGQLPYYQYSGNALNSNASLFSPSHEVPSPGMLGSLSTGIDPTSANNTFPWRTLLFRPSPYSGGSPLHFGATSPEDHLVLDLFWMPIDEPYAISEPFTSAGKININYQIQPFTYITRSTGIRAVLNTEKVAAVNVGVAGSYKSAYANVLLSHNARYPIDVPTTLKQFDDKFNGIPDGVNTSGTPDIFHSASQICDMYLVPLNSLNGAYASASAFATQWYDGKTYGLVGDNVRERPYANIYGQITTKSNTYTVYYTVQSLKNAEPAALQKQWDETKGSVVGEYRGSTTIERYIDPNKSLPDFAANPGADSVDGSPTQPSDYNWRIVENHQFAP